MTVNTNEAAGGRSRLALVNTAFFAAMIVVNMLANIIPLGIGDTGAVSGKYENLFTPAPVTFMIWGVIYILMALFVVYQWGILGEAGSAAADRNNIGILFALSCALNIGWMFAWHYDRILISTILIACLLTVMTVIGQRIADRKRGGVYYLAVNAGFDLYFGWLIAATIANISVLLVSIDWNGFGIPPVIWTSAVLIAGALIGILPVAMDGKWMATAAVIWAYAGILIRHIGQHGYAGKYPAVIAFAIVGIVIMLMAVVYWARMSLMYRRRASEGA